MEDVIERSAHTLMLSLLRFASSAMIETEANI